jgi:hypothetical protein
MAQGSDPGTAGAARDPDVATEVAPGIFVQPASVDFGVLEPARPSADAKVTVTWTGARPERMTSRQGNEWWTNLGSETPASSCIVFHLRAQAQAWVPNGRHDATFRVTLDDTPVRIPLTAEIRGMSSPASPPVGNKAGHAPPSTRRLIVGALLFIVVVAARVWSASHLDANLISSGSGGGATASASPPAQAVATPSVPPTSVPQSREGAIDVRPVFTASQSASDKATELGNGMSGPPVQQGFEILVPLVSPQNSNSGLSGFCVTVTVPQSNAPAGETGAAGETFTEYPVGTIAARGGTDLAFPAVLPGGYALYRSCSMNSAAPVTLGTVTTSNLGVLDGDAGSDPGNAMMVFAVQTSGATTTVSYGAIGQAGTASFTPPANDSCIHPGSPNSRFSYSLPVQSLVSQQVIGAAEWFETGTLVFHGSTADGQQTSLYYNCAEATPSGQPGVAVP